MAGNAVEIWKYEDEPTISHPKYIALSTDGKFAFRNMLKTDQDAIDCVWNCTLVFAAKSGWDKVGYELIWSAGKKLKAKSDCQCGAHITYGISCKAHSSWCNLYGK